jgi:HPt (histidine-containing phosphotransfer) domain-containing protein
MAEVLDAGILAQLADDLGAEDLREVARRYRADCTATLAALAAAGGDEAAWHRAAHRLASDAGTVGAADVAAQARALAAALPPAGLAGLRAACEASCDAFERWAAAL